METNESKVDQLWRKLLVGVLIFCSVFIPIGYLYYRNSTCVGSVLDCFEFEIIIVGAGVLLFSLPLIAILFAWEMFKKFQENKKSLNAPKF